MGANNTKHVPLSPALSHSLKDGQNNVDTSVEKVDYCNLDRTKYNGGKEEDGEGDGEESGNASSHHKDIDVNDGLGGEKEGVGERFFVG